MGARENIARLLMGKPGGPTPEGIRVYHSSPHDFDRFDLSKLRTGEGANVYGSGFYFAENPKVSGQGGEYWRQFKDRFEGTPEGKAAKFLEMNIFNRQAAIDFARHQRAGKDVLDILESDKPIGPRTYEVNIKAKPEELLDWDKPLSQQTIPREQLAEVAYSRSRTSPDALDMYRALQSDPYSPAGYGVARNSGADYYKALRNPFGRDQTSVSEALREAGIPGIRYLDQGSRTKPVWQRQIDVLEKQPQTAYRDQLIANYRKELAAEPPPSYNYVAFDPGKLDIMAKYGIAGAPAGLALGSAFDQSAYAAQPDTFDQRWGQQ